MAYNRLLQRWATSPQSSPGIEVHAALKVAAALDSSPPATEKAAVERLVAIMKGTKAESSIRNILQ